MQDYLPPDQRRNVLRTYGSKYGLRTFVETGTYHGDTTWALKDDFDILYTIELGDEPFAVAAERFASVPNVYCLHGDSADLMPAVLSKIDGPALFWLDGHYSGDGTARGPQDTPVGNELMAILSEEKDHVVLVDDARCFGENCGCEEPCHAPGSYPTVEWVQNLAKTHGYYFVLTNDIMRMTRA